ncbi:MAG: hypothetical protein EPO03_00655, partial [Porticoccaceae bacterium]
ALPIFYSGADLGTNKAVAAARQLGARNDDIAIEAIAAPLSAANVDTLVASVDLVLDCTDQMPVRYLINAACRRHGRPWLFAGVERFAGQLALFVPDGACFQCLYPTLPEQLQDCAGAGVLGVVPGVLGLLQAGEALKYLTGLPVPSQDHLLLWDGLGLELRRLRLRRDPACRCCGGSGVAEMPMAAVCSTSAGADRELSPSAFAEARQRPDHLLVDVRSAVEYQAFNMGGLNIPVDELQPDDPRLTGRALLLLCQTGVRSGRGAAQLRAAGREAVFSLRGGIVAWLEEQGFD